MEKEKKIQIIKAAVKRFTKHGLNKTTLDEIARDLRIGKATIYHYFQSKEDLYFTTINWRTDEYIGEIKKIFEDNELTIEQKFLNYFTYKEDIYNHFQLIYELMLRLLGDLGHEKELEALNYIIKSEENVIASVLNSLEKKNGNTGKNNAAFIVIHSWGLVFGNKMNLLTNGNKEINSKENLLNYLF